VKVEMTRKMPDQSLRMRMVKQLKIEKPQKIISQTKVYLKKLKLVLLVEEEMRKLLKWKKNLLQNQKWTC